MSDDATILSPSPSSLPVANLPEDPLDAVSRLLLPITLVFLLLFFVTYEYVWRAQILNLPPSLS